MRLKDLLSGTGLLILLAILSVVAIPFVIYFYAKHKEYYNSSD